MGARRRGRRAGKRRRRPGRARRTRSRSAAAGASERDGQSLPDYRELAALRRHSLGRGDRHHPRRQGRYVAASSIRAPDPAHRCVGQYHQAVRRQDVRAGARLLPGSRRQLLGWRQRTLSGQPEHDRARVPDVQVQSRRQSAADVGQGRRVEGRSGTAPSHRTATS